MIWIIFFLTSPIHLFIPTKRQYCFGGIWYTVEKFGVDFRINNRLIKPYYCSNRRVRWGLFNIYGDKLFWWFQ